MNEIKEMSIEDALVLMKWLNGLGYPTKAQMELLHAARKTFADHAQKIESKYSNILRS